MRSNVVVKTFVSLLVAVLTTLALLSGGALAVNLVLLDDSTVWEQSSLFGEMLQQRLGQANGLAQQFDLVTASLDGPDWLASLQREQAQLDAEIARTEQELAHIDSRIQRYVAARDEQIGPGTEVTYWYEETERPAPTTVSGRSFDPEGVFDLDELHREAAILSEKLNRLLEKRDARIQLNWSSLNPGQFEFVLLRSHDAVTNRRELIPESSPFAVHSVPLDAAVVAAAEQLYHYVAADGSLNWGDQSVKLAPGGVSEDVRGFAFTPKPNYGNRDGFNGAWTLWYALHGQFVPLLVTAIVSAVLAILLMVWLFSASGHVRETALNGSSGSRLKLAWFDHIPFDLLLAALFIVPVWLAGSYLFNRVVQRLTSFDLVSPPVLSSLYNVDETGRLLLRLGTLTSLLLFGAVLMFGILLLSLIRRVKLRAFLRTTLLGRILLLFLRGARGVVRFLQGLSTKPLLLLVAAAWLLTPLLILLSQTGALPYLITVLVVSGGFYLLLHYYRRQLDARDSLQTATARLAAGDIEAGMARPGLAVWDEIADNLDSIGSGVRQAVEERMQSERLKAELITNVSHDLKTPLTSIINYVDLLHRPELSEAERADCLAVLTQKSEQLKRLTEDLVEASKASSGAVAVTLEQVDVFELLQQAGGEYRKRLDERQLTLVLHLPPGLAALTVQSDSRHLWRILDNLLGNAAKYALAGSRVHLALACDAENWTIRIRNVSEQPIDLSAEELMERFVRGDRARSSEGSGLGLAIARGLTERLGGSLTLAVEQDLFTVELRFSAAGSVTLAAAPEAAAAAAEPDQPVAATAPDSET